MTLNPAVEIATESQSQGKARGFQLLDPLTEVTVTHKSALWTKGGALSVKGLKGLNSLAQGRAQERQPHSGALGKRILFLCEPVERRWFRSRRDRNHLRSTGSNKVSATTVTQGAANALPWASLLPPFRRPPLRSTAVSSKKDMGHDPLTVTIFLGFAKI